MHRNTSKLSNIVFRPKLPNKQTRRQYTMKNRRENPIIDTGWFRFTSILTAKSAFSEFVFIAEQIS
uniref:Uncharacterized protein n=1 Tax=Romanomermis culicivorax TaxID=13658 RepID=A0A915JQP6_ROMCU